MAYIINQDFEGSGIPGDWHPSSSGNFDYTAVPLEGAESLRMFDGVQAIFIKGAVQNGEQWGHFLFRIEDLPSTAQSILFLLADDFVTSLVELNLLASGILSLDDDSGTNSVTLADPIAADTTYHIWWRYKQGSGSNSEKELWVNTADDRDGSPADWHGVNTTGSMTVGALAHSFVWLGTGQQPYIVDRVQWTDTDEFAGGTITRYVNTASAGGDGTTNALSGANAAFASLRAALTSMPSVLTSPVLILCEGVAADTLSCTQTQWDFETTAANYITVRGNNSSGKYDTTKYRIETTDEKAIYNNDPGHVRLEDLQVQITITTSASLNYDAFRLATANNQNGPVDHRYERCIAKFVIQGGATDNGIGFIDSDPTSGGTCVRINCIAYGGYCGFDTDSSPWAEANVRNYNCTGYGNEFNFADKQVCVNCLSAAPSVGPGFNSTGSTGHAFNASDDATAVGMGSRTNQTFSFVNAAAGDFHLLSTDKGAKGFGLTDPASGLYDDDIDGQIRVGDWDIGADESPEPARIIFEKAS